MTNSPINRPARLDITAMIDIAASTFLLELADDIADALLTNFELLDAFHDADESDLLKILTAPMLATIRLKIEFCPIHNCDLAICADDAADCSHELDRLDRAIADAMR